MKIAETALYDTLSVFEGDWAGEGQVFPNLFGPGGSTAGTWRFGFDPGGFNFIHDYRRSGKAATSSPAMAC